MTQETEFKETLTYIRVAHKAKDGSDGFLYLHSWGTGYQELIFDNHEAAGRVKIQMNTPEWAARLQEPA